MTTFWQEAPIMPGAAKYFIRTEKIEKKTKTLNNHPIKIQANILNRMLKQLSYKYDRDETEIPLFSTKELILLSEYVPQALMNAKADEDVTFVIKGPHSSKRWILQEDRLTSGRIFVSNNQLNLIIGSVQVNLQPTLEERYAGNVWETTKLIYDIGYRKKTAKYDGLIVVLNKNQGIYRKSNDRKDWFIFTNTAYKKALSGEKGNNQNTNDVSNDQYEALQQQIDTLQKQLNNKSNQKRVAPQRKQMPKKQPSVTQKNNTNDNNPRVVEQRLKTIENLYNKGILSKEEYQKKRNEILKGL